MNRRNFFGNLGLILSGIISSPTIFIPKLEPVKWKVIYEEINCYKHSCPFPFDVGFVYAPYIPLYQTCDLIKISNVKKL